MEVTLIAAMDLNRVIGRDDGMPWHLPADFAWFKKNTLGKPIVMGRTTYESIGRPLPKRTNIVLSRRPDFDAPGCLVASDIDQAFALAGDVDEVMICGGGALYEALMPRATRLLVTVVHACVDGDTRFPAFSLNDWEVVSVHHLDADEKNAFDTSYWVLTRREAPVDTHVDGPGVPAELRSRTTTVAAPN